VVSGKRQISGLFLFFMSGQQKSSLNNVSASEPQEAVKNVSLAFLLIRGRVPLEQLLRAEMIMVARTAPSSACLESFRQKVSCSLFLTFIAAVWPAHSSKWPLSRGARKL